MWGGDYQDTPPTGYLHCNGQTVSRTTYAALFAVVGTTYGVGDGSTTFGLPDLQGKFPIGESAVYTANATGGGSKDAIVVDHGHDDSGHSHTSPSHGHSDSGHGHSDGGHRHSYTDEYRSVSSVVASGSNYGYNPGLTSEGKNTGWGYANIQNGYASIGGTSVTIQSGTASISNTGSSGTDANLPPYIAVNYLMRDGL